MCVCVRTHIADVDDAQRLARPFDEHQRDGQGPGHIPKLHHERAVARPLLLSCMCCRVFSRQLSMMRIHQGW